MKPGIISILFATALAAFPAYAENFDPEEFISVHNKWRIEVGVEKKLSYSPALAASAQNWADNLKQTNNCKMRHSKPDGKYGENLYWGSAVNWSDGRKELQKVTPNKWWIAGVARKRITSTKIIAALTERCAATTRRWFGEPQRRSAVPWRYARTLSSKCGYANTSRQATGWATSPIDP